MESQFIKSRQFTLEECRERLKDPIKQVAFEITMEDDDFAFEDTILLPIAAPRAVWKILYASSISAKTTVADIASEWLSDTAFEILKKGQGYEIPK